VCVCLFVCWFPRLIGHIRSLLFFVVDSVYLWVCPSVCLFVTDKLQIDSSFLAVSFPTFLAVSSPRGALQNVVLRFLIYPPPPNAQNLLPEIACDNATLPRRHPWSRPRQFSSCLEKVGNPLNFRADHCCQGNEIWPRRGDLDAYRLVCLFINTVTPETLAVTEC